MRTNGSLEKAPSTQQHRFASGAAVLLVGVLLTDDWLPLGPEKGFSRNFLFVATVAASMRRIRPCLMTSATTILALIPVLTSTGRGSDVMAPMAIPSFGGMLVVLIKVFFVTVLYCAVQECRARVEASAGNRGFSIRRARRTLKPSGDHALHAAPSVVF